MATLAIDWGKKRIWLAYTPFSHDVIFPLWFLDNTQEVLYALAHLLVQYHITRIIIGYPARREDIQKHIDAFIRQLQYVIDPECLIERVNEDYSSVQANALVWVYRKTAEEDSLAAMYLLEEWQKKKKSHEN